MSYQINEEQMRLAMAFIRLITVLRKSGMITNAEADEIGEMLLGETDSLSPLKR